MIDYQDPNGHVTYSIYDSAGDLREIHYPDDAIVKYEYHPLFHFVTRHEDARGNVTTYVLNLTGDIHSVTNARNETTTFVWGQGLLHGVTDALGRTTTTLYDSHRRPWMSMDPMLGVTWTVYDSMGNVSTYMDQEFRSTTTVYDANNRLRSRTTPEAATTSWEYDVQGSLIQETTEAGVTKYRRDSRGWVYEMEEAVETDVARLTSYERDSVGNVIKVTRPRAYLNSTTLEGDEWLYGETHTVFDSMNRPIAITEGVGSSLARTRRLEYDNAGNLRFERYSQAYDSILLALGGITLQNEYEYDSMNRLEVSRMGSAWMLGFQVAAPRIFETLYDLGGNPWYVRNSDGMVTVRTYDELNRVEETREAVGTALERQSSLIYDEVGNIEWSIDSMGVITRYGYDGNDRMIRMTEAYDTHLQRTTLYDYDSIGRLRTVWNPRAYNAEVVGLLPDGTPTHVSTRYTYSDAYRSVTRTEAYNLTATSAGTSLAALGHVSPVTTTMHNASGDVILIVDSLNRMTRYEYDALGRQTAVKENYVPGLNVWARSTRWTYDAADNLRSETREGVSSGPTGYGGTWQSVTDRFQYDLLERRTASKFAVESTGFYAEGTPPSVSTALFDAADNLVSERDARGTITLRGYNRFHELETIREGGTGTLSDPVEFLRTTTFDRDAAGRVITETTNRFLPGQATTGNASVVTKHGYDVLGRATSLIEGFGTDVQRTTFMVYDAADRLISTQSSSLHDPAFVSLFLTHPNDALATMITLETVVDELGRVELQRESRDGKIRVTLTGHDAADNIAWTAAPRVYGNYYTDGITEIVPSIASSSATIDSYLYDGLNRLAKSYQAVNATAAELGHSTPVTEWRFDAANRITFQILPKHATAYALANRFNYDPLDQLTRQDEGYFTPLAFTTVRYGETVYEGSGQAIRTVTQLAGESGAPGESRPLITDMNYDAFGQLRRTIEWVDDPRITTDGKQARVTDNTFDAGGLLVSVVAYPRIADPLSQPRNTRFEHDRLGRTTKATEAWYDLNVAAAKDAVLANLGHDSPVTQVTFDAIGNILVVTDPHGVTTVNTYDVHNRLVKRIDGANAAEEGNFGKMNLAPHGGSPVWEWEYDAEDHVVRIQNPLNQISLLGYDELGRSHSLIEASGTPEERKTLSDYDAADNLTERTTGISIRTDGYSHPSTTGFVYDALNRQREVLYASDQSSIAFGFSHSRPWTKTKYDALGGVVEIWQNASTIRPDGVAEQRENLTRMDYDQLHRPIETVSGIRLTSPGSTVSQDLSHASVVRVAYDSADNLIELTDANGIKSFYAHDLLGRKVMAQVGGAERAAITLPLDRTKFNAVISVYGYDVFDNLTVEDLPTDLTKSTFDLLGRLKSTELNPQHKVDYGYDIAGNKIRIADSIRPSWYLGNGTYEFVVADQFNDPAVTQYDYDALHRVREVTDTNGRVTKYKHDKLGRVESVIDRTSYPVGSDYATHRRSFTYDSLNRQTVEAWRTEIRQPATETLISTIEEGGFKSSFDAADNVIKTLQNMKLNGEIVEAYVETREYDSLDRLTKQVTPFGIDLEFKYDAASHRIRVTDSKAGVVGGVLASDYDSAGRLAARRLTVDGQSLVFTFESQTRDIGREARTKRFYASLSSSAPIARMEFEFDPTHGESKIKTLFPEPPVTSGTNYLESFAYSYKHGTRLIETENRTSLNPDFTYGTTLVYDPRGQVTSSVRTPSTGTPPPPVALDGAGMTPYGSIYGPVETNSQLAHSSTGNGRTPRFVDPADSSSWYNEYDSSPEVPFNGNSTEGNVTRQFQTSENIPAGTPRQMHRYTFNFRNQLTRVEHGSYTAPTLNSFTLDSSLNYDYDGAGQLIQRIDTDSNNVQTSVIRFLNVDGEVYAEMDGQGAVQDRYVRDDAGMLLGRIETRNLGLQRDVYATDRLGSVVSVYRLESGSAAAVRQYTYVGLRRLEGPTWGSPMGGSLTEPFTHSGRYTDPSVGLQWDGSRWLDPKSQRFLSETPFGRASATSNLYSYANNSWANPPEQAKRREISRGLWSAVWRSDDVGDGGFWDRAGAAYNESETFRWALDAYSVYLHFWGGVTNAMTFGLTNGVAELAGYDESQMTKSESMTWGAGEVVGTVASVALGYGAAGTVARAGNAARAASAAGNSARAARAANAGFAARTYLRYEMAGSLYSAGKGAYEAGTRNGGATWQDAVAIGGGLVGARGSLGGLAQAGAAGRLGRGYLGAEKALLTGTAAGRGVSAAGRATATAAFHTVNTPLSLAVHGGLKRISTSAHDAASNALNRMGFKVCFAAGTPLRTPEGWKWIESFREGDLVLSRDENDPNGLVVAKVVEEVFVREGLIWNLHIGGQVIRTTAEHPFFVDGRGWVACHELKVGERLLTESGEWAMVEDQLDTGEWETVYNLRIADFHTYFVGCDEWGFSVWAHNRSCGPEVEAALTDTGLQTSQARSARTKAYDKADPKLFDPNYVSPQPTATSLPPGATQAQVNRQSGNLARDHLAGELGLGPQHTERASQTVGGARIHDVLEPRPPAAPLAHESKVGYTSLTDRVRQEIARSWWARRQGQIENEVWHFYMSAQTGEIGASQPLMDKLNKLGFKVEIHDTHPGF